MAILPGVEEALDRYIFSVVSELLSFALHGVKIISTYVNVVTALLCLIQKRSDTSGEMLIHRNRIAPCNPVTKISLRTNQFGNKGVCILVSSGANLLLDETFQRFWKCNVHLESCCLLWFHSTPFRQC